MEIETIGDEVRELQRLLQCLGYYPKDFDLTGYYGPITQDAVIKFQKDKGLDPIGVVGPATRDELNKYFK